MYARVKGALIGDLLVFIVDVGLRLRQHGTTLLFSSDEIDQLAAFRGHLRLRVYSDGKDNQDRTPN
jgi:hypothetical protein